MTSLQPSSETHVPFRYYSLKAISSLLVCLDNGEQFSGSAAFRGNPGICCLHSALLEQPAGSLKKEMPTPFPGPFPWSAVPSLGLLSLLSRSGDLAVW